MKEAIVLAGGLGTRLQLVVNDKPKCMATVAGNPFLKYMFDYLEKEKFTHVILALGYRSESVLEWLEGKQLPFEVSHVIETEPLGTGGAIRFAMSKSKSDSLFVLNGDTYFDVNTDQLSAFHQQTGSDITIALKPMVEFDRYGSVEINNEGRIIRFNEKKYQDKGLINGGVYFLNKSVLNNIKSDKFSFEKDILESRLTELNIYGDIQDTYFIDIGIPSDYEKANVDFLNLNK